MNEDSVNQNESEVEEINDQVGPIDNSVLNTPAREPKDLNQVIPTDKSVETYFQLNKPDSRQPDADIILDVDGKAAPIKDTELTPNKTLMSVMGMESEAGEANPASAFLIIAIIVGAVVFVAFSLKRADYIRKLEQELENTKNGHISQL